MDDKRKIIIREIEQWRKSKLLPEHYCDFLLNLYLEEGTNQASGKTSFLGITPNAIKNSNWKIWVLLFGFIAVISLTALNFTAFNLPMQIGVSLTFLFLCYATGSLQKDKEPLRAQILFGMASLFLLFIGVYLFRLYHIYESVLVVGYVVLCSLIWLLTGLLSRFLLFQLSGWVALVFCYGWLLHYQLDSINWVTLELSWVPLSLLFGWLGWLLHQKTKQTSTVFLMLSCIVWFMPELYGMLYAEQYGPQAVQLALVGKIFLEASVLFTFRKKWTEWVA
ncbi:hypothetical protein GCM10023310_41710 [Paenibacillus vulneris]|uniref:DUF2157 domain-containing protein n=1 Tax=Paenibacillus vulneris TaxID=1133364 RepID=A0ABW3URI9_9BACL|nr:hypothetical protein [Paenibacillus sp. OAS669]MBE1443264.1 hypothetical protein [Paenibacillus sp. OAS669]